MGMAHLYSSTEQRNHSCVHGGGTELDERESMKECCHGTEQL